MADFMEIIKTHAGQDGAIPADAIAKLEKAICTAVGNEFVEKSRYKAKLEEIETLKTDKQTAEDSAAAAEKWKEKYNALKGDFDAYKRDQSEKESKAAKESAARAYFEGNGITGKNLAIALRGSRDEIAALELSDGKIKDTAALDALVANEYSGMVEKHGAQGADVAHPPANSGKYTSKKDIMAIADRAERRAAIAGNMELFEKGE